MAGQNDLLESLMSHGIDMRSRTVYLDDDIDSRVARKFIRGLRFLDKTDGKITMILNTGGGDVSSGFAIYGAIKNCRNEVHVEVFGCASSMGSIIMQAADKRFMDSTAKIMIHYGEIGMVSDHCKNVEKTLEENKRENEWMENLFIKIIKMKRPKFTKKRFKEEILFDRYINANEALKLGLVDEILNP